jgi:hypothetical protein
MLLMILLKIAVEIRRQDHLQFLYHHILMAYSMDTLEEPDHKV